MFDGTLANGYNEYCDIHYRNITVGRLIRGADIGVKLIWRFSRHSFSIKLTDEGILLRNRAEDLVSMADRIEKEFISLDDITGGDLYFGLAESFQICYLARAIHTFKQTYPGLRYHITSGDTEQVMEKLDKGLLDFVVLAETPDDSKYESLIFPDADVWGLVMPEDDPLAKKKAIRVDDLIGLPLFCSEQSWEKDIPGWAGEKMDCLHLEGSFRLAYNASIFTKEHLGYLLTFNNLVNTSPGSGLAFRPLKPRLETRLYLVWKKYQTFSPIAERFMGQLRTSFKV